MSNISNLISDAIYWWGIPRYIYHIAYMITYNNPYIGLHTVHKYILISSKTEDIFWKVKQLNCPVSSVFSQSLQLIFEHCNPGSEKIVWIFKKHRERLWQKRIVEHPLWHSVGWLRREKFANSSREAATLILNVCRLVWNVRSFCGWRCERGRIG